MSAQVWVGGVALESVAPVSDLTDSTIWRLKGYSGDYEAAWSWSAPANFSASWFHAGATVEIREGGLVVWRGFLGEPEPSDGGWACAAFGDGADAANFIAADPDADNINTSIAGAHTAGMRWSNYDNDFTGGAFALRPGYMPIMLDVALDRVAASQGAVWYVTRGVGELRTETTTVAWTMLPDSTYLGVTDENFVTSLSGFYVSSVDVDGNPDFWSYTAPVEDLVAEARIGGPRQAVVDLTALGLLSMGDAGAIVAARFPQVAARSGFTNGFEMNTLNSRSVANDTAAPMLVRAGDRIRVPGVTDMYASPTFGTSVTVTAGRVVRNHTEQRVSVEPVGMVERDFSGALAAAQPKQEAVETL